MKKIFVLFFAISFLASCNNNPFGTKKAEVKEKTDKDDRNTKDGYDDKDDKDTKRTREDDNTDSKSSWTARQEDKWLDECIEASQSNPQAKKICSCVLEKIEKKYPEYSDAENASEAEGVRLAKSCMEDLGINTGGNDNNDPYKRKDTDDDSRGSWTSLQRQQFIQGCASSAQRQQGFTTRQANTYCECMTNKVEKKFTFQEAAKLTPEDLQTREWQQAAADCLSGN